MVKSRRDANGQPRTVFISDLPLWLPLLFPLSFSLLSFHQSFPLIFSLSLLEIESLSFLPSPPLIFYLSSADRILLLPSGR